MIFKDFVARVKAAAKRVAHHAAGVALAEHRIKHWREVYVEANRQGDDARRADARKRIIYWKTHEHRAEDFLLNWRRILKRRRAQKKRWLRNHPPLTPEGFAIWRGVAVAPWMVGLAPGPNGDRVDWLQRYVEHGWSGEVNSGVRTPEHSEELCLHMCGAPSCSGTCAGRSSNHNCTNGCAFPAGAIDVGDFSRFKAIGPMIGSPLINDLPIDPVHFSVSGH